ncbi:DUF3592 domain-containing protein [Streptomyces sp. NPDC050560]|uniref:DUF3592 domain-containing protein n=1 Tax=Streptomyces sp. NPDC050560 TaxID=3365630 RepID=UPI00378E79EA
MGSSWAYGLIPLALGVVFLSVGVTLVRRTRALRRDGGLAYARVVDLATSMGQKGGVRYHPVVRFVTADGRETEARATIGKSWVGRRFRPGADVVVRYDRARPSRMVIEGYSGGTEWVFCALGVLLLAVAAAILKATLT